MTARYAIYYAPPAGSLLEERAAAWLGRGLTGAPVPRPAVPVCPPERLEEVTATPRLYGFHATLKPPFHLAAGATPDDLRAAARAFAAAKAPFEAPPLTVSRLGSFLCLRPIAPAPDLDELAAACLFTFEPFRAPPTAEDLEKRRATGLSARQDELLRRWGYPYVMDEFRFHMTLTGPLASAAERTALHGWLSDWLAPALEGPLPVHDIAVYVQADRSRPFVLHDRFPLGG